MAGYLAPREAARAGGDGLGGIAVPLRLQTPAGPLALISTTTVFGTPVDVTLAELAIEAFFPGDEATAARLAELAAAQLAPA